MTRILLALLTVMAAFGADDWAKVRALKTGTEIRLYTTDVTQPILAKFADLTDESVIIIVKNEQKAIPRDQIQRFEARPQKPGGRVTKQTTITNDDLKPSTDPLTGNTQIGHSQTYSSGVSITSKPNFETIYTRKTAARPKK